MAKTSANQNAVLDVTKVIDELHIPGVDVDAVLASQRKNIEALTQANQFAVAGAHAVLRHQIEIAGQTLDAFSEMLRDFLQSNGSAEGRIARQAEYSKKALEKAVANVLELTELVSQANTETVKVINNRIIESLDEISGYAKKRSAAA